jgi:hypothetical protein
VPRQHVAMLLAQNRDILPEMDLEIQYELADVS